MQILINIDHNITLTENSTSALETLVETALAHFASRLTRVDVHLSDQSAGRSTGNDIRCLLEARPEGLDPQLVTDDASSVDVALRGALHKMLHALETDYGRLDQHKGASSMGGIEPR